MTYKTADIYNGSEKFLASIASEPREAVVLYAAHFCQSEVHNGGLLQFFWNQTGVLAPEAVLGFEAIGMPKLTAVLKDAMAKLGGVYPRERDDRWDALLLESGYTEEELETIFSGDDMLYLKFAKATDRMGLDDLNRRFWDLAKNENGGFSHAADVFAETVRVA